MAPRQHNTPMSDDLFMHLMVHLDRKDKRIANLQSLLSRERYFHRAWRASATRALQDWGVYDDELTRDINQVARLAAERSRRDK